ncbi:MAG: HAD family hydrolase [Candidatus Eisenbacteria bacterium]
MSGRPALDAVVFDAGGTLVRLDFEWMAEDLAAHGFATDVEALRGAEVQGRRAYDASSRPADPSARAASRVRGDVRAYFRGTLEAAGVPEGMVAAAVERFLERERARGLWCRPMEGAREALEGVRALGLRAAVVSNSDGRAEVHLANADMLRGIEFVVDSHLVGIEKPDPAIFAVALARLGTAPDRTLFVGDLRSVDEAGAGAAGMRFVLLDPSGDYAAPGSPRVAGMYGLAAWVEATFEVPRSSGCAPSPGTHVRSGGGPR